jgi:hypothetical protein
MEMTNGRYSALVEAGLAHLGELFDTLELQEFIYQLRNDHFDYTEWRRDNLFPGMTLDEILDAAAEHERIHGKPQIRGPQPNI